MKIEKSDRRLLIWTGAVLLPLVIALAFLSQEEEENFVPSTYSAQSRGAKAAYLLLQDLGYKVERWEQPPTQLPSDPERTVLVLASPFRPALPAEKNALQNYLSRGGKILETGSSPSLYLPLAETERESVVAPDWKKYQPQLLSPLTRGGAIEMSPSAYWKNDTTAYLVHYADESRPIVVSHKVGKGEVIWWAASTPLTNAAIAKSGNMALLLNSLGEPGVAHIYWDEYFHNTQQSFTGYLSQLPLLYGFLQCLLVFAALIFTFSRRNGPIHPLPQPARLSPLEFVYTLGKLYRRGNATRAALEVPYARFRMLAARQLGLSANVSTHDLSLALKSRMRYKDNDLSDLLEQIETALRSPELAEASALELAQRLSRYTQNLKSIPLKKDRQETTSHADRVAGSFARTN